MTTDRQPDPPAGLLPHAPREDRGADLVRWLIGINLAVFVLWVASAQESREATAWMVKQFTVSPGGLAAGRWWTLLTSVFSHYLGLHLLINLIVLYSFARALAWEWGPTRFLVFYLIAGLAGSLTHVAVASWVLGQDVPALGASGAVCGVVVAFALRHPGHPVYLFFVLPVPALVVALLFIGFDIYGLLQQARGAGLVIGHGAHLGGALAALFACLLVPSLRTPDDRQNPRA